ncbi:hypothetical protein BvCmsKSNP101_02970 [Escherichia coli]|nr:hypothetical protein BvCmsKSNP101_02970 [Escherichia coli]
MRIVWPNDGVRERQLFINLPAFRNRVILTAQKGDLEHGMLVPAHDQLEAQAVSLTRAGQRRDLLMGRPLGNAGKIG